jgi:hypothetical protein
MNTIECGFGAIKPSPSRVDHLLAGCGAILEERVKPWDVQTEMGTGRRAPVDAQAVERRMHDLEKNRRKARETFGEP